MRYMDDFDCKGDGLISMEVLKLILLKLQLHL